jgi:hypothetical protein
MNWLTLGPLPHSEAERRFDWRDGAVIFTFLLFAALFFLARLQRTYPAPLVWGDSANIASFAAALDHPQNFQNDELLYDLDNIRIYATMQIPLIRLLYRWVGEYGLSFLLLLGPTVFLQLVGFYILGRAIFASRYWALLLSLVSAIPTTLVLQEFWGIVDNPLPRFTFQALLPFVLALFWVWREKPLRWSLVMLLAGFLVYVHPVSTPAWITAIWLGCLVYLPHSWRVWQKISWMGFLGVVSLLVMLPFIYNYLTYHEHGQTANNAVMVRVLYEYFPKNLLNPPAALIELFRDTLSLGVLLLGIAGFVVLWILKAGDRRELLLTLTWLGGIVLVSVALPTLERLVERIFNQSPFETELPRGIRYLYFFLILYSIWGLSELRRRARNRYLSMGFAGLGLIPLIVFASPNLDRLGRYLDMKPLVACWTTGRLFCPAENDYNLLVQAIRQQTPETARFYFSTDAYDTSSFSLRYLALRSLVYSYKDRGLLAYSNAADLEQWYQTMLEASAYKSDRVWMRRGPDGMRRFLDRLGVDYLIVNFPVIPERAVEFGARIEYQNNSFTLLEIIR